MLQKNKQIKRVVIKIGSSSLTSQYGEISRKKLEELVDQIVTLKDAGYETVVVSSGAVAAGYRKLGCIQCPSELPERQAAASIGQGLLMESYSELFLSHGYVASQILITRSDFSDETRYWNIKNTLNVLLERGIIPIINENDTVTTDRLKFGDNDTLAAKVAALIQADQLIILSDVEGLYSSDPNRDSNARLLEKVHIITPEIEKAAGGSGSEVGTGGMKSKLAAVKIAMASGILSFLGKAGTRHILMDAVKGMAKGTYFEQLQTTNNLNEKKQWIAFHSGPEGNIIINRQVIPDIVYKQKDIYPRDIQTVTGQFVHGDVVNILSDDGEDVGIGRINYSYQQLRDLKDLEEKEAAAAIKQDSFVCSLDYTVPV